MPLLKLFPFLCLIFFTACSKEEPSPILLDECSEIIPFTPNSNTVLVRPVWFEATSSIWAVSVNPNNGEEIVFARTRTDSPKQDLIKYNSITNEMKILVENMFIRENLWNEQDWIIFHVLEEDVNPKKSDIWKIRSNGEDLTRLTFSQDCFNPIWRNNGEEFIANRRNNEESPIFLYSNEGMVLDSFSIDFEENYVNWKNENEYISLGFGRMIRGNIETETIDTTFLEGAISDIPFGNFDFIDSSEIITASISGIFKANLDTGEAQMLKETCKAEFYLLNAYSPSTNRLIMKKIQYIQEEDAGGIVGAAGRREVQLISMDINGQDERIFEVQ